MYAVLPRAVPQWLIYVSARALTFGAAFYFIGTFINVLLFASAMCLGAYVVSWGLKSPKGKRRPPRSPRRRREARGGRGREGREVVDSFDVPKKLWSDLLNLKPPSASRRDFIEDVRRTSREYSNFGSSREDDVERDQRASQPSNRKNSTRINTTTKHSDLVDVWYDDKGRFG